MTLEAGPGPWSQRELDELAYRTGNVTRDSSALVELLDVLDTDLQQARRVVQRQPYDRRAWISGYADALAHVYDAVERQARACGLLESGWWA